MKDTHPTAPHKQLFKRQDFLRHLASGLMLDNSSSSTTDADGCYAVAVPVAEHYVVSVWEEWAPNARKLTVDKGGLTQGHETVWDLALPNEPK